MIRIIRIAALSCSVSLALLAQAGRTLPRIDGSTLNEQKVSLPDPSRFRAMVLVFGFTHKSSDQADAWGKRLAKDYATHPEVAYFEVPVLQGAPGMIRPMIVHGMRKGTPADEQGHVLPIDKHEDELKKLVGYKEADDAYVIVADSAGNVAWQSHGMITDVTYAELARAVAALRNTASAGDK